MAYRETVTQRNIFHMCMWRMKATAILNYYPKQKIIITWSKIKDLLHGFLHHLLNISRNINNPFTIRILLLWPNTWPEQFKEEKSLFWLMVRKDLAHPDTNKMALRTQVGSPCLRTQAAEEDKAGVQSASSLLPFCAVWDSLHEVALPTLRVGLSSSVTHLCKNPHRHTQS